MNGYGSPGAKTDFNIAGHGYQVPPEPAIYQNEADTDVLEINVGIVSLTDLRPVLFG